MFNYKMSVRVAASVLVHLFCAIIVNGANNTQLNCEQVKPFFATRNISVEVEPEIYGSVCGGKCCSSSMELDLRLQVQRDFSNLLRHNSRSLQGLLDTTASTLQEHVVSLTHQSQNKTLVLFTQVYQKMASHSHEPIISLYTSIRRFIQTNDSSDIFSSSTIDIKSSVLKFFTDIFPLVYHRNINTPPSKDFTSPYKVCLKQTINEVVPFGDTPKQILQSLHKSLEATRLLLQALAVGEEVLNTTETLLTDENNERDCHEALVKLTYCPKCIGLKDSRKPCSGYCLNVLRGCLTRHVAELDSPWNGYVEAMERLVVAWKQHNNEAGVNIDAVIRALDTRISEAIMYAMENVHELEKRVKKACGQPKMTDKEDKDKTTTDTNVAGAKKSMRDNPPPETQLLHFLTSVAKSRGFYTNLADNLCKDESFAETMDQNCWNGQRIGEYTKTVVGSGLGMQKYNPEVQFNAEVQNGDPKIANLADKLRHVHNMVITSLGTVNTPESDSFMQGDAADGSGSGGTQWGDDTDDDGPGSGSGWSPSTTGRGGNNGMGVSGPIETPSYNAPKQKTEGESPGSGVIFLTPSLTTLALLVIALIRCIG